MRDVQAVFAAEREQEVVACNPGDLFRLEAEQLSDAVVLVHDVVTGAQVRERLEGASADPRLSGYPPAEHLMVGQQREPERAPHEAAPPSCDDEEEVRRARELVARLEQSRVDLRKYVLRAKPLS